MSRESMSDIRAWKKIRSLGEGGQGQTFVVQRTDRPDERQYVLKSLNNLDRGGRFDSEITALSRLAHPNVVQILDHGDDKSRPVLVMDFFERGDLAGLDLH